VYVCNCNGIRERQVHAAIERGCRRPADVFRHCNGELRCAKCVCDMKRMIRRSEMAAKYAVE
jgi:bacterioferritin-associated ferredoxin